MNESVAVLLGVVLGLRHALDADHVVVVSALVQREPGRWRAARLATLWGVGHTITFLGLGLAVVVMGLQLPPAFDLVAEVLVGAMLIGVGAWHLASRPHSGHDEPSSGLARSLRPIAVGVVHGLAGSAGVALVAVTTMRSRWIAVLYLALVALGTVLGMLVLTLVLAQPLAWTGKSNRRAATLVRTAASLLGIVLGGSMILSALITRD